MNAHVRIFDDVAATRDRVPLLIGLMGPSGSGKTYSALRLATGIQSVAGGDIYVIDTESGRAKHYADFFKFRHVPFAAPFSPMDYLAAIEQQVKKGAGIIVVDSMSHEHEGQGGVLEMHEAELDRMAPAGSEEWKRNANNFPAWAKPKAERRKLISGLLQLNCNFIFCFRAKEKTKPGVDERGKKALINQGWMPIAGEEFLFEQTANMLLLPGSQGVPTWRSEFPGERSMMKIPEQFKGLLDDGKSQLSEEIGRKLAVWATGDIGAASADEKLCRDAAAKGMDALQAAWKSLGGPRQKAIAHLLEAFKKQATTQSPAAADPAPTAQGDAKPEEGGASSQPSSGDALDEPDEIWNHGFFAFGEGKPLMSPPQEYTDAEKLKWKDGWRDAEMKARARGKV